MIKLEVLDAVSNVSSEEELNALKLALARFFATRARIAVDKLWDEGKLNQEVFDDLRHKHLRTPYKK